MKSLGISIARDRLSAVLWEKAALSSRPLFACAVPCREPFGGADDVAALAEQVRKGTGAQALPPAVLSLPPAWTFLREIELPVQDLPRAKAIHLSELEGTLPFEDDEILSDILPPPPGCPGRFLAVAARRPVVEKAVSGFLTAGFRIDRIVPDIASILSAVLSFGAVGDGLVLSTLSDVVALRVESAAIAWARQFPGSLLDRSEDLLTEWKDLELSGGQTSSAARVTVLGELPAVLSARIPNASPLAPPSGTTPASPIALGAALLPWRLRETGDFSLKTSAVTESALSRERSRMRIGAASVAAALVAVSAAVAVAGWAEARKAERIQSQLRKELSEIFPGTRSSAPPAIQLQEKMAALRRQQKETDADAVPFPEQLRKVAQVFPQKERISVSEIGYDAGKLRIVGDADSPAAAESFRAALATAFGPESTVALESSQGRAGRGTVTWSILVEKKEPARAS
ncbi:MAG: hypothetical protein M1550_05345 [Deltaproteobacteria bacterium]|nr:hypothetical protein [Deltaproteobacteria bacterium]